MKKNPHFPYLVCGRTRRGFLDAKTEKKDQFIPYPEGDKVQKVYIFSQHDRILGYHGYHDIISS